MSVRNENASKAVGFCNATILEQLQRGRNLAGEREREREFGYLNLDQVDWLEESGRGGEHAGVQAASGGRDDLTTSSVDGVCVQGDIIQVEADATHVLLGHRTL